MKSHHNKTTVQRRYLQCMLYVLGGHGRSALLRGRWCKEHAVRKNTN